MKIIASEGHGEYALHGDGVTVTPLWDPHEHFDFNEEGNEAGEITTERWTEVTELPESEMPDADFGFEHIVQIEGEPEAIRAALVVLVADLSEDPGADDGTFDYWPSGMRLALALADVLNAEDMKEQLAQHARTIISDDWRAQHAGELYQKIGLEIPRALRLVGATWVVITRDENREITDLELLSGPPEWDLAEHNQICFVGNVNGGDSLKWEAEA